MKRLARNAAELMTLAATLQSAGIQLELLTGPLTDIYDPTGMGSMLFAILGGRRPTRPRLHPGQDPRRQEGRRRPRQPRRPPGGIDPDSLIYARALRDAGPPLPKISASWATGRGGRPGRRADRGWRS